MPTIVIPNSQMKIGDHVRWICRPYRSTPFVAWGYVEEVGKINFGGKHGKKQWAVKIRVACDKYLKIMPRQTTWISFNKIMPKPYV